MKTPSIFAGLSNKKPSVFIGFQWGFCKKSLMCSQGFCETPSVSICFLKKKTPSIFTWFSQKPYFFNMVFAKILVFLHGFHKTPVFS